MATRQYDTQRTHRPRPSWPPWRFRPPWPPPSARLFNPLPALAEPPAPGPTSPCTGRARTPAPGPCRSARWCCPARPPRHRRGHPPTGSRRLHHRSCKDRQAARAEIAELGDTLIRLGQDRDLARQQRATAADQGRRRSGGPDRGSARGGRRGGRRAAYAAAALPPGALGSDLRASTTWPGSSGAKPRPTVRGPPAGAGPDLRPARAQAEQVIAPSALHRPVRAVRQAQLQHLREAGGAAETGATARR